MNQNEQARLAAAVHCLRPEWPVESLRTFIGRDDQLLAKKPVQDAAAALVWVALDEKTRTPARVNEPGPWWHIGRPEPEPMKGVRCQRCGITHMPTEDHQCRRTTKADRVHDFADELRRDLARVNEKRCLHKTPVALCVECSRKPPADPRPAEETENA